MLGVPPLHIIEKASRRDKFFEKRPGGNWVLRRSKDHGFHIRRPGSRSLNDILGVEIGGPSAVRKGEAGHAPADYQRAHGERMDCDDSQQGHLFLIPQ